jgi:hypothetical protein
METMFSQVDRTEDKDTDKETISWGKKDLSISKRCNGWACFSMKPKHMHTVFGKSVKKRNILQKLRTHFTHFRFNIVNVYYIFFIIYAYIDPCFLHKIKDKTRLLRRIFKRDILLRKVCVAKVIRACIRPKLWTANTVQIWSHSSWNKK